VYCDACRRYSMKKYESSWPTRRLALERDNHTCQICGLHIRLTVHHIDGNGTTKPKEERNDALDNLITLCRGCHCALTRLRNRNPRLAAELILA
jgi:5-methylcytosine-specific restriction endonuclease McrA